MFSVPSIADELRKRERRSRPRRCCGVFDYSELGVVPDVLHKLSRKSDFFKKNRENGGEKLKQGGSETDESSEKH
jgi:hypothetical protein